MSGSNYCFTDLTDHERVQCGDYKRGGIDAIAIIDTDANISNYSSAAAWQAAIDAENVKIIKGIKAEFPEGSRVEGENPVACGAETVLDGVDFTLSVKDFNVSAVNDEFWATANGNSYYIAYRLCNEDEIVVIEVPVTVKAVQAVVPMSNKEKQHYPVILEFSVDANWFPARYAEPAAIFD
jgi:hypothetical protein